MHHIDTQFHFNIYLIHKWFYLSAVYTNFRPLQSIPWYIAKWYLSNSKKLCIRLQVTMGCCKFIFVYTARTIITVSPEINIIFKKRRISSHIPKWYLEKDTLYSCQVFLKTYFYFWKACLISQIIFTWY